MKTLITLMKREYMEHKVSTFWFPVVFSVIAFVSFAILAIYGVASGSGEISFGEELADGTFIGANAVISVVCHVMAALAFMTVILVQSAYFLGSLYDDRKDQSIIFWRSLPVAEWQTITSKFLYGSLVLPLFYFASAVVVAIASLILGAILMGDKVDGLLTFAWIIEPIKVLVAIVPIAIWLMPVWIYLMCASALAKRLPIIYAAAPFVVLSIIWGISHAMNINLGIATFFDSVISYLGRFFLEQFEMGSGDDLEVVAFPALHWQFLLNWQQLVGSLVATGLAFSALKLRQRSETV
ncbi:hypothetical protein [Salinibius halmophilus]|uniref:hypothetical protein n=1 Tax=Salinibius halmophilus TaxID=1853216 RepID=UPI000E663494|nr:hypothetical protein [Salinibius halmophilus]